ncbi:MAG: OPT/YSL family transporter, partial [Planctomycetes bacterium]|nr:OPT/YSL family transporter [Planctomycetota bacterium]
IVSMIRVLPVIVRSARAGMRDITGGALQGEGAEVPRTERDLPLWVVVAGALALVLIIWIAPPLHMSIVGAILIVLFGFLFVTVSSRLTGEIGSSSNPISGMTVATLLMTCLIFLVLGWTTPVDRLTALSVAAIVCIAASNGGTTSQDLKTGFLVGGTPKWQQLAILVGALTSALVIGSVLDVLNEAGTVYTKKNLPDATVDVSILDGTRERIRGPGSEEDATEYLVWRAPMDNPEGVPQGKYLVDDAGRIRYLVDPAINGRILERDDGTKVTKFDAPKTQLMALIIDGVLTQKLPWGLVLLGVLIALTLELAGVPSLPFAVGVYLPLSASTPIFTGGLVRYAIGRYKKLRGGEGESDSGPGVLLSSGYIAGGTIAGVVLAFLAFTPIPEWINQEEAVGWLAQGNVPAIAAFAIVVAFLVLVGIGKILGEKRKNGAEV